MTEPKRFSVVEQYRTSAPATYLADVEAAMVGRLAAECHKAGRVFRGWPTITRELTRWDSEMGRFVAADHTTAEYEMFYADVVGVGRVG